STACAPRTRVSGRSPRECSGSSWTARLGRRPVSEALLETAADILGRLVDEVVFVGGATVHLWLTETAAPPVRATDDVDVICDVTSYAEYQGLAERLRDRGLEEASDEPVICRWHHAHTGLVIDVMPRSEDVLGFSNPWY